MNDSVERQAAGMPEIGDGLNAQLVDLWRDPTPQRCEAVAANLGGARMAVLRLREALLLESDRKPALLAEGQPAQDDRPRFAETERGYGR